MELNKITKTTHYVDYHDLAEYISSKVGRKVEIGDSRNDTDYGVKIEKREIDSYDQEYVNMMLERGWISMEYGYNAALNYCANQGWIEEGDYVIRVSW